MPFNTASCGEAEVHWSSPTLLLLPPGATDPSIVQTQQSVAPSCPPKAPKTFITFPVNLICLVSNASTLFLSTLSSKRIFHNMGFI